MHIEHSPEQITKEVSTTSKRTVIPCKCSDHNAVKLEINHKKKLRKSTNTWRLNNVLLNSEWVKQEIKEGIKKYMETNKKENTTI